MNHARLLLAGIVGSLIVVISCTPGEQQAVAKGVEDAASCIEAHATPAADPGQVAIACGINAIPDVIAIIVSVIDAKKLAARGGCTTVVADAGGPDGVGK